MRNIIIKAAVVTAFAAIAPLSSASAFDDLRVQVQFF